MSLKVVEQVKKKKVALLGTVPHKLKAPFQDNEFEIWAIAHACLGDPLPRVDRIFEIHKWDEVVKWGSPQAWEKLHPGKPVYMIEPRPEVPNSVAFPFDEIEKKFQIFEDRKECLMTNSISWMIALAIDEGFEEIHIYGVNMSHSSEYGFQKPSVEYYLGLCKGMGKKIYIPTESDLCKSFYLYGKDEEKQTDMLKKLDDRLKFVTDMHVQYTMQQQGARDMMNKFAGALEQWEAMLNNEKARNGTLAGANKELSDKAITEITEKVKQLTDEWKKHQVAFEQARDAINQHIGAIEDVKYMQLLMKQ